MAAPLYRKFFGGFPAGVILAVLGLLLAPAPSLAAEKGTAEARNEAPSGLRGSVDRLRDSAIPDLAFTQAAATPPTPPPHHKRSTGRKFLGFILGAGVGMVAGFAMGAALEPDCNCDDPGLEWGLYGAGIGIVAGGTAGVLIASR